MTHARARAVLLAVVAAAVMGIAVPAQADAAVSYFSCVNKPSDLWCDGRANGTYDGQDDWNVVEGWHMDYGQNYGVCQRLYKPSTGGVLSGDGCAVDFVHHYYGQVQCACYDAEIAQTSGGQRTIYGFADSTWVE